VTKKPLRVAFNARLLRDPSLRGWNRYTVNLLANLPACGIDLFLYSDTSIHPDHLRRLPAGSYSVRISPPMRYLAWEQCWLPAQCRKDRVDLLHCPLNFGLPWRSPCPRVLTLHDAIDTIYYSRRSQWRDRLRLTALYNSALNWVARTRAQHIITVREHAANDLTRVLRVPRGKQTVIPEAADENYHRPVPDADRALIRQEYNLDKPYVFYVGGWEGRKNIPHLLNAFARAALLNVELVMAGGKEEQRADLSRLAAQLGIHDRLKLIGWVPEEHLPAMYSESLCFVYPSEYEGFGLQVCEAMATGCPVLVADRTSLPEVLGGGGVTFNLRIVDELTGLLRRLANEPDYRKTLVERAKQRATAFSWQRTAEQTAAVYRQVAA